MDEEDASKPSANLVAFIPGCSFVISRFTFHFQNLDWQPDAYSSVPVFSDGYICYYLYVADHTCISFEWYGQGQNSIGIVCDTGNY